MDRWQTNHRWQTNQSQARLLNLLETVISDIRHSVRSLLRSPLFTTTVILTLALGIGANTAIFTLLDAVVLRPLPVPSPQQLYALGDSSGMTTITADEAWQRDDTFFSYPLFQDLRLHNDVFTDLAAISSFPVSAYLSPEQPSVSAHREAAQARLVSGSFFETLGVRAAIGRTITAQDNQVPGNHPVVVVSHAFWLRKLGGDQDSLGRPIHLNGIEYTLIGVMPVELPGLTSGIATDLWVPMMMQAQLMRSQSVVEDDSTMWLRLFGRLADGVSPQLAEAHTNEVVHRLILDGVGSQVTPEISDQVKRLKIELSSFSRGFSVLRGRYSDPLLLLLVVVALVLLIACANISNLLLARAAGRQQEVALRFAIGSTRGRLLRHLLTESLVLALAGGAIGLLVAHWTIRFLLSLITTSPLALDVSLDLKVLSFTLGVSLVAAVLFGLMPALRACAINLQPLIKGHNVIGKHRRGWGLRQALVVSQVAVSLLLLFGAGLFLRSLGNLRGQELGFAGQGLLQAWIDPRGAGYTQEQLPVLYQQLRESLEALPEVSSASLSFNGVLDGSRIVMDEIAVEGFAATTDRNLLIEGAFVSQGYFKTIGAQLLAGRPFDTRDSESAPQAAIVNQTFARTYFGDQSPIGQRFGTDGESSSRDIEIIGLVRDHKIHDLWETTPRMLYLPVAQRPSYLQAIQVRCLGQPLAVAEQVRAAIAGVAPQLPVLGIRSVTETVERSLRQEKMLSKVTGFFSLLALLLSAIGLYGVLAYGVAQRTREIGVRIALGAPGRQVLWMVLRTALQWVAIGAAIGLAVTLVLGRLLSGLLFDLTPTDPATIALATAILLVTAALASYLPARRAARLDPIHALRRE